MRCWGELETLLQRFLAMYMLQMKNNNIYVPHKHCCTKSWEKQAFLLSVQSLSKTGTIPLRPAYSTIHLQPTYTAQFSSELHAAWLIFYLYRVTHLWPMYSMTHFWPMYSMTHLWPTALNFLMSHFTLRSLPPAVSGEAFCQLELSNRLVHNFFSVHEGQGPTNGRLLSLCTIF